MKAAYLDRPGRITIREVPVPACADDEVLIRVREIGLCGSDIHYFVEGRIGDHVVQEPHILGHECAGEVVEVGRAVQGFRSGDRVAVEPGRPCLSCESCREGRYNLCDRVRFLGVPGHPGAFREYLAYDPRFVYRLPDSASLTAGALVEPLAVALNAARKAEVRPGQTVLITGAGAIGMSCLQLARAAGASTVIVSDPLEFNLAVARKLGAAAAVDPLREDLLGVISGLTGGRMCDAAVEAAGSPTAAVQCLQAIRRGGRVVLVGMGIEKVELPHTMILKKEAVISGLYRYANQYPPVIELLKTGALRVEDWVTHRFPLEELQRAMETARDPSVDKVKIMITCG